MYTLHCTIGINWDLYVPWADEGLSFSAIVDKPTVLK